MPEYVSLAVAVSIGLTIGAFAWQWITGDQRWSVAFDRSFYQIIAIVTYVCFAHRCGLVKP
jgi:hypothetical protein